jgi:hypothetical protein
MFVGVYKDDNRPLYSKKTTCYKLLAYYISLINMINHQAHHQCVLSFSSDLLKFSTRRQTPSLLQQALARVNSRLYRRQTFYFFVSRQMTYSTDGMVCIPNLFGGTNLQFSGFCPNPSFLLYFGAFHIVVELYCTIADSHSASKHRKSSTRWPTH